MSEPGCGPRGAHQGPRCCRVIKSGCFQFVGLYQGWWQNRVGSALQTGETFSCWTGCILSYWNRKCATPMCFLTWEYLQIQIGAERSVILRPQHDEQVTGATGPTGLHVWGSVQTFHLSRHGNSAPFQRPPAPPLNDNRCPRRPEPLPPCCVSAELKRAESEVCLQRGRPAERRRSASPSDSFVPQLLLSLLFVAVSLSPLPVRESQVLSFSRR